MLCLKVGLLKQQRILRSLSPGSLSLNILNLFIFNPFVVAIVQLEYLFTGTRGPRTLALWLGVLTLVICVVFDALIRPRDGGVNLGQLDCVLPCIVPFRQSMLDSILCLADLL